MSRCKPGERSIMTKRPVSYMHPTHGTYAQYHGAQAGFYRGGPRALRRAAEAAAHAAGSAKSAGSSCCWRSGTAPSARCVAPPPNSGPPVAPKPPSPSPRGRPSPADLARPVGARAAPPVRLGDSLARGWSPGALAAPARPRPTSTPVRPGQLVGGHPVAPGGGRALCAAPSGAWRPSLAYDQAAPGWRPRAVGGG